MYIDNTEQKKEPDIKLWKMFFASEVRSYYDDKKKKKKKVSAFVLTKQIQK